MKSRWLWRAIAAICAVLVGYWLQGRATVERLVDDGVLALASTGVLLTSFVLALWSRRISALLRAWTRDPAPPLPTSH